jgi:hypothetical protein
MWTVAIPNGNAKADLDSGDATFEFHNLQTVFDVFAVPNSFDTAHAMGFVSAAVEQLRITWSGVKARNENFTSPDGTFTGTFVQSTKASIAVTVRTPATEPPFTPTSHHGFEFVSDPETTVTGFAQIGRERNGTLK